MTPGWETYGYQWLHNYPEGEWGEGNRSIVQSQVVLQLGRTRQEVHKSIYKVPLDDLPQSFFGNINRLVVQLVAIDGSVATIMTRIDWKDDTEAEFELKPLKAGQQFLIGDFKFAGGIALKCIPIFEVKQIDGASVIIGPKEPPTNS